MKKISIKLFFFISFILFFNSLFAQSTGAISGNNYFVAASVKENGANVIQIYKFMTKEFVRKLSFKYTNTKPIDEIKFSHMGTFLYTRQAKTYTIFDIMGDKQVASIIGADQVILANNSAIYAVLKNNKVSSYNASSGELIRNFSMSVSRTITKIEFSPDDNFIVGYTDANTIFVWKLSSTKEYRKFVGSELKFRENMKFATILVEQDESLRAITYNLPSFDLKCTKTSDFMLKEHSVGGVGQHKVFPSKSSLSKDGSFVAIYTAKNFNVDIYVFNTITGNLLWKINNTKNTNNSLYPHFWTYNKILVAYGENMLAGEYDIANQKTVGLALKLDAKADETELNIDNQAKNRKISPNQNYVVMQTNQNGVPTFNVRAAKVSHEKISIKNTEFLCFSDDSRYIFVLNNNVVNVIITSDIDKAMQANRPVKLYPMDQTLKVVEPEKMKATDANSPKGYAYFFVNNTKQIALVDTAKLQYAFRSITTNANDVEIKVNLLDANGNLFLGATDPNWRYIWCNLILQNAKNQVSQVQDFIVEEVNDNEPAAIALVLDHSGSMGKKRANSLQYGALKLVKNKRADDAYLLIKYDHNVKLETKLTKQSYPITQKLNNSGLTNFGGATALIDATHLAITKLKRAEGYKRKVVILFTDGHENCSFFNKFDVIKDAVENNIEVHIIGFGDDVNEQYLKSIAYSTGGSYNHIYKTEDLEEIFTDIDHKRRNYYSIKFKTPTQGKQVALLELCQDEAKHDSLLVPFDNTSQNKRYDQQDPVPPLNLRTVKLTEFKKLIIPRNVPLKPVDSKKIKNDFDKIDFPDILFSTAKASIVKSEESGIDAILKFMKKYPYVYLEIHGHTDNHGSTDANLQLSKDRADAAKKLLTDKGVASGRIRTRGFGETKPISTNDTEEGRKKNRRIEFLIFKH